VQAAAFALRQQVNDAFFTAALLQARRDELSSVIADLEARLQEANVRVREGAALAGDAAAIEATVLQRREEDAEVAASRKAALVRLHLLTGAAIASDAVLAMPTVDAAVESARGRIAALRARPEYAVFSKSRDRLERQEELSAVENRPRVSAFAAGGLGRPGLNFIGNTWEAYWLSGVQLEWRAWTWGTTQRNRQELAVGREIVAADEAAFTADLERAVQTDIAAIDRLTGTIATDDRIIGLREAIDRGAKARFRENVITAADYLDRSTELLEARFTRASHEIERAQAGARLLTTLGIEVPR
jgi:outer membrane protein TolC